LKRLDSSTASAQSTNHLGATGTTTTRLTTTTTKPRTTTTTKRHTTTDRRLNRLFSV